MPPRRRLRLVLEDAQASLAAPLAVCADLSSTDTSPTPRGHPSSPLADCQAGGKPAEQRTQQRRGEDARRARGQLVAALAGTGAPQRPSRELKGPGHSTRALLR